MTGDTATFDVELGAIPSYDLKPRGLPIVLTLPTWVTVGPSRFWGGAGNFGVYSTGLVATMPLPNLPTTLSAAWTPYLSIHAGVQYYRILNDRLLLAQTLVGTAGAATHLGAIAVFVIDRQFARAAAFALAGAILTFFGLIHAEAIGLGRKPTMSIAYLMVAALLLVAGRIGVAARSARTRPDPDCAGDRR